MNSGQTLRISAPVDGSRSEAGSAKLQARNDFSMLATYKSVRVRNCYDRINLVDSRIMPSLHLSERGKTHNEGVV